MLQENLDTVINTIRNGIGDLLFQQNNAPIHKAGVMMEWLENSNIDVAEHLPYCHE